MALKQCLCRRAEKTRISFRNSHLQYAMTWYGLAGVLVIIALLFLRKSRSKRDKAGHAS